MRSKRLTVSLILVFAILGVLPVAADVRWKNGQISEATPMGPAELSRKMAELATPDQTRRVVVHLARPADARLRAELDASGVRLLGYLGDDGKGQDTEKSGWNSSKEGKTKDLVGCGQRDFSEKENSHHQGAL